MRVVGVRQGACLAGILVAAAFSGCGGGAPLRFGDNVPGETVQRLAGDYDLVLQLNENLFGIRISGTSNILSGSGVTAANPGVAYTYTGSLATDGLLALRVSVPSASVDYDIDGAAILAADGTASGTGTWRKVQTGALGSFQFTRTVVLPVANGPANSLVDVVDLSAQTQTGTRGLAISADGNVLATYGSGKLHLLDMPGKSITQSIALATPPNLLALSGDGNYLYAAGDKLHRIALQNGVATEITASVPIRWLSTPGVALGGSRAYLAGANGQGIRTEAGAADQLLPSLGQNNDYDFGTVAGDNSRVLVTTRGGAASVGVGSNTLLAGPFTFAFVQQPTPAPIAASMNGRMLYAVEATQPPRVVAVDMDQQRAIGALIVGTLTTRFADMEVTPDGSRLLLVTEDGRRLYILDAASLATVRALDVRVSGPSSAPAVAVSPDSSRAYVSGRNSLAVVRLK